MDATPFTAIKSQEQYKAYCDMREDLSLLIAKWEEANTALPNADPVRLLGQLMKENKIKAADLATELEISKSLLSDILHYRRKLSKKVIRKLASKFKVPQQSLNKPYQLDAAKAAIKDATKPATKPAEKYHRPKTVHKDTAIIEFLKSRTGKATIVKLQNGRVITIWNIICGYFVGGEYANINTNACPHVPGAAINFFSTSEIEEFIDPAVDPTASQSQTLPNQTPSAAPSPNRSESSRSHY
jgi:HTH-type transcriptional regulator/antitoxin HigA